MLRMFSAYKNGESTVYHNDGKQHKREFEKCGNNVSGGICDSTTRTILSVWRFNQNYEVWQKSSATGNAVHEPTKLLPPPSHGS
jgi:hypothetical protein